MADAKHIIDATANPPLMHVSAQPGAVVYRMAAPNGGPDVIISNFAGESQLSEIMALMKAHLSEPYNIYTYRHFLDGWSEYSLVAHVGDKLVGAILCKTEDFKGKGKQRGYIAMLAVDPAIRKVGLGRALSALALQRLCASCDEVVLETEASNDSALRLYEGLGFLKDKRLPKYYLNGQDAYRLKLWFK